MKTRYYLDNQTLLAIEIARKHPLFALNLIISPGELGGRIICHWQNNLPLAE